MDRQTNFTAPIHLCSLSLKLRDLNFGCCCRIGGRNIKLKIKFIFDQLMNVPTLAFPMSSLFIRWFDGEPIKIAGFVDFNVLYQSLEFL